MKYHLKSRAKKEEVKSKTFHYEATVRHEEQKEIIKSVS